MSSCTAFLSWLGKKPYVTPAGKLVPYTALGMIVLGLGMAIRAVNRVQFTEPDEPAKLAWPAHLINSSLGMTELDQLQSCAKNIAVFADSL